MQYLLKKPILTLPNHDEILLMSINRYILSQVCIPDYFFPFPPYIRTQFIEESLCGKGFISIFMIIDKEFKKNTRIFYNFTSACKELHTLNNTKNKTENPKAINKSAIVFISEIDGNINHEIDYMNIEELKEPSFNASISSINELESSFEDKVFAKKFTANILSSSFAYRKTITQDIYFILPKNDICLEESPDSENYKKTTNTVKP